MNYYKERKKDYSKNKYELKRYYSVGILIAKSDNKFVMEYCSNEKIFRTTYELV